MNITKLIAPKNIFIRQLMCILCLGTLHCGKTKSSSSDDSGYNRIIETENFKIKVIQTKAANFDDVDYFATKQEKRSCLAGSYITGNAINFGSGLLPEPEGSSFATYIACHNANMDLIYLRAFPNIHPHHRNMHIDDDETLFLASESRQQSIEFGGGDTFEPEPDAENTGWFAEFDSKGSLKNVKTFNAGLSPEVAKMETDDQGNLYMLLPAVDFIVMDGETIAEDKNWFADVLVKLDKSRKVVWSYELRTPCDFTTFIDFHRTSDNNIVLVGNAPECKFSYDFGEGLIDFTERSLVLAKISTSSGELIHVKTIPEGSQKGNITNRSFLKSSGDIGLVTGYADIEGKKANVVLRTVSNDNLEVTQESRFSANHYSIRLERPLEFEDGSISLPLGFTGTLKFKNREIESADAATSDWALLHIDPEDGSLLNAIHARKDGESGYAESVGSGYIKDDSVFLAGNIHGKILIDDFSYKTSYANGSSIFFGEFYLPKR